MRHQTSRACSFTRTNIIPWFAEKPAHPFVPLKKSSAAAQSGSHGRSKTGAGTLPLTAASTVARLIQRTRGKGFQFTGIGALALLLACAAPEASLADVMSKARLSVITRYDHYIVEAARHFGVPSIWIRQVMQVESAGERDAISRAGAMGLMQIMPATWLEMRARYHLGRDPFDPHDNILAGAAYLRELYDRYGSPGFLAAYNAGPKRYEQSLGGRPLPRETRAYVAKLAPFLDVADRVPQVMIAALDRRVWTISPLFVSQKGSDSFVASTSIETPVNAAPLSQAKESASTIMPSESGLFIKRSKSANLP